MNHQRSSSQALSGSGRTWFAFRATVLRFWPFPVRNSECSGTGGGGGGHYGSHCQSIFVFWGNDMSHTLSHCIPHKLNTALHHRLLFHEETFCPGDAPAVPSVRPRHPSVCPRYAPMASRIRKATRKGRIEHWCSADRAVMYFSERCNLGSKNGRHTHTHTHTRTHAHAVMGSHFFWASSPASHTPASCCVGAAALVSRPRPAGRQPRAAAAHQGAAPRQAPGALQQAGDRAEAARGAPLQRAQAARASRCRCVSEVARRCTHGQHTRAHGEGCHSVDTGSP